MTKVKRIYHTWDKWECYPAGFYEPQPPNGMTATEATQAYAEFLRDIPRFERYLFVVTKDWRYSCEHYLTNEAMNRIAWLGQAAMCAATRIPHGFRGGFNILTEQEKKAANEVALKWLNLWIARHCEPGEPCVDLDGAGINAKVNLY